MKRTVDVDKEYTRFHGQKAIDKFFKAYPELIEWKETVEWMMENNTEHFIDDTFGDGTYNNEWCYSIWFEDDEDFTYIAITLRA